MGTSYSLRKCECCGKNKVVIEDDGMKDKDTTFFHQDDGLCECKRTQGEIDETKTNS